MLLIFLAIGGVIAYLFLSKRQQPVSQGTNTILGSTGTQQPMITQSKAGKQRTDNTAAYIQAGAGLLSSLVGGGTKSGVGAQIGYTGDLPFIPGGLKFFQNGSRAASDGSVGGVPITKLPGDSNVPITELPLFGNPGQYSAPIGPIYSNPNQYSDTIGPLYTDTSGFSPTQSDY